MKATEEHQAADNVQNNQLVTYFASSHAASQGNIATLTTTNAAQQQQIVTLQALLANNAAQVMYVPPFQQPYDETDAHVTTATS